MRVLVTGATGFVGRALVPALLEAGHEVRAATRHPEAYDGPGEAVRLELGADDTGLREALHGCQAAYYLVHSMAAGAHFATQDLDVAMAFRDEAAQRGTRVVYLGGLGEDTKAADHSAHLHSRHQVGTILRNGADTVELRAAIVIGRGSTSFEILHQLVERLPVMLCPRWVATRCQPIARDDVVRYLVGALDIPAGSYDIGGADVLTYEQMMRRYAGLTGRHRVIIKVPVLSPSLSAHWIGLVTDQDPSVARPLAEGLAVEVIMRDCRIRELMPFQPLGFDDAVRVALNEGLEGG